ncbi:MAG TPA: DNRLRE domain-containing protein [Woeseiaceae bacterium]|nr:DNRLRE domain-containing protein [Woeseiaceae bacterium]
MIRTRGLVSVLVFFSIFLATGSHAQSLSTTADTALRQSSPNTPSGNDGWLHINSRTSVLLAFELAGAERPVAAMLQVQSVRAAFRGAGVVEIVEVVNPWTEGEVTWANAVTTGRVVASKAVNAAQGGQVISFDVSSLVNDWIRNPGQNFGLMLRARDANINMAIRSRESQGGASSARLVLSNSSNTASANVVTVAPENGDYDNPVAAAANAHEGDTWCDRRVESLCKIIIEAGTYEITGPIVLDGVSLLGYGPALSVLRAAPGVRTVVQINSEELSTVANLTIVNDQASSNLAHSAISATDPELGGGRVRVESTKIMVGSGGAARGIEAGESWVADSDIKVTADNSAAGIHYLTRYESDEYETSRANVSDSNIDVEGGGATAGVTADRTRIYSSIVRVFLYNYGDRVVGIEANSREDPDLEIIDSDIRVSSASLADEGRVASLYANFYCSGEIRHSTLHLSSSDNDGIALEVIDGDSGTCPVIIDNSVLTGTLYLPSSNDRGTVVTINNSRIDADVSIRASDNYDIRIGSSQLSGAIELNGATIACAGVHDENYRPRGNACERETD